MKVFLKICEHDNAKFVSKLLILVLFFQLENVVYWLYYTCIQLNYIKLLLWFHVYKSCSDVSGS